MRDRTWPVCCLTSWDKLKILTVLLSHQIIEQAIAAMHGPHNVFDIGYCTVILSDAGGVSLVDP